MRIRQSLSILLTLVSLVLCGLNAPVQAQEKNFFGIHYDPAGTKMTATEYGKPYEGVPKPLVIENLSTYIQPWNGFCPDCTSKDAKNLPCQTANIKALGMYKGIEVQGNQWVEMACDEARSSVEHKGGPFGAVVVQIDDETKEVIRYWRNHNHVVEWCDPTAHAEVTTIRAACQELGVFDLGKISKDNPNLKLPQKGATSHCEIYVNGDCCSMCYTAIRWARISTIVFAATRFDASAQGVNFSDEPFFLELAQPFVERKKLGVFVYQSTVPNSLDAFNLFKRSASAKY